MHWLALQHPQLIHAASRRLTADQIHISLFNAARATISGICSSRTHTLARTRQAPARPQLEHTPPVPVLRPQVISLHLGVATCSGVAAESNDSLIALSNSFADSAASSFSRLLFPQRKQLYASMLVIPCIAWGFTNLQ